MITELRKAQDSWIAKAILGLTALSFMSIFGISGYINRSSDNPNVIRVNKRAVSQMEFNSMLDKEVKTFERLFGGNADISEEMRTAMAVSLAQREVGNLIAEETAARNNVFISDDLVRGIIYSQVQFRDDSGNFNPQAFKYFLSNSGISEQQYIDNIRLDLKKQFLVQNPVSKINVPEVLRQYAQKAESQRKIFKYITINDDDMKISREISEDEINQYFEDFSGEFTVPEKRDLTVMTLSFDDVAAASSVSDEEIAEYYKNNLDKFVTPETREVLQIMTADEETAAKAKAALDKGEDFFAVAQNVAKQSKEETSLDYVSKDMLLPELADDVFEAKVGAVVGPLQSELGWHILKVTAVKAGSKVDDKEARRQIAETLKQENAYENTYELMGKIEDEIGAGKTLPEIAKEFGGKIVQIKNLSEDGQSDGKYPALTGNHDFVDTAFSYNKGEVSQAVEIDNGLAFVAVENIVDSHQMKQEDALPKIKQMWTAGEKSAIAQEIINDVVSDLENGDSIDDVAKRYKLKLQNSGAVTRNELFGGLNAQQVFELFGEDLNAPKQFDQDKEHIVAVAVKLAEPEKLDDTAVEAIARRLNLELLQQAGAALTDSYGKDYDIRIKYRLMGLAD